jgi:hypothetical protein
VPDCEEARTHIREEAHTSLGGVVLLPLRFLSFVIINNIMNVSTGARLSLLAMFVAALVCLSSTAELPEVRSSVDRH